MEMTARARKALKGSIRKWERIVAGTGIDKGGDNCPLCTQFANEKNGWGCIGCPIAEHTGASDCARTPYSDWSMSLGYMNTADTPERKKHAKRMLAFLKRLDR